VLAERNNDSFKQRPRNGERKGKRREEDSNTPSIPKGDEPIVESQNGRIHSKKKKRRVTMHQALLSGKKNKILNLLGSSNYVVYKYRPHSVSCSCHGRYQCRIKSFVTRTSTSNQSIYKLDRAYFTLFAISLSHWD
jgi:hypothetical protein